MAAIQDADPRHDSAMVRARLCWAGEYEYQASGALEPIVSRALGPPGPMTGLAHQSPPLHMLSASILRCILLARFPPHQAVYLLISSDTDALYNGERLALPQTSTKTVAFRRPWRPALPSAARAISPTRLQERNVGFPDHMLRIVRFLQLCRVCDVFRGDIGCKSTRPTTTCRKGAS